MDVGRFLWTEEGWAGGRKRRRRRRKLKVRSVGPVKEKVTKPESPLMS